MKLQYQPPVLSAERIPPPLPAKSAVDDPPNFGFTLIGVLFPPAGLCIWLVYLLSKPNAGYRQAECALLGAGIGLLLAFAGDLALLCGLIS